MLLVMAAAVGGSGCASTGGGGSGGGKGGAGSRRAASSWVAPRRAMEAKRGSARAVYPRAYRVSIRPDGQIVFPDGGPGKIQGDAVYVGTSVVARVRPSGDVSGSGLRGTYRFNDRGELIDDAGDGVRILSSGAVVATRGRYRGKEIMAWTSEGEDEAAWDRAAWRTLAVLSLLVIDNLAPQLIH